MGMNDVGINFTKEDKLKIKKLDLHIFFNAEDVERLRRKICKHLEPDNSCSLYGDSDKKYICPMFGGGE